MPILCNLLKLSVLCVVVVVVVVDDDDDDEVMMMMIKMMRCKNDAVETT